MFDNLVKFVYKLGKNWQTRAWVPVFKTAGSAPDAAIHKKGNSWKWGRKLYGQVRILSPIYSLNLFLEFAYAFAF